MVLETSAAIAILLREEGYERLLNRLMVADAPSMSAVSYMEASIVMIARRGAGVVQDGDDFLAQAKVTIVPVTGTDAKLARDAFIRFGKGRHAATLNFGDCFSYALARRLGEPLLFKGGDFALTDILRG